MHAHYSNIRFFEGTFDPELYGFLHFVDPGLIHWLTREPEKSVPLEVGGTSAELHGRLTGQLEWIAGCGVDAILVTCTNYIAELAKLGASLDGRVAAELIAIDEPWFGEVVRSGGDCRIAFTNPATVEGTMGRLQAYAAEHGVPLRAEAVVADRSLFDQLLQGRDKEYAEGTYAFLAGLTAETGGLPVAAAQLSMADAARTLQGNGAGAVIEPLGALQRYLAAR
ncbi:MULTISPECIES: hypothetical protein [Paenibacillus]|uniref:hypothetical protein n=1 Tax=Paenibacillus TaxID=44249 RepID=UPI0022B8A8C2|nr:hypothetical protein [Paenibacillus caseinilyticus]MCZ8520690.1 hypothetical protein [Paenibacillus caseinilyticus]